jgi:hypothetical protein
VRVALDIPQTVGKSSASGASNLLLFRGPIRELDFVGEQNTASHDVNKTELGLDSTKTLLCNRSICLLLHNLNTEEIVGISLKSFVTVGRNLILPVGLSDRWANVMRVKAAMSGTMVKTKDGTVGDVLRLRKGVPGLGAIDGLAINSKRLSLVLKEPHVVVVLVRVQGDLLLLATGRVHERMRVEVTTLSVDMADGDTAAHDDIGGDILHTLVIESGLELGAHEAITVTRVLEADEVDGEHGHVEGERNDDETEDTSHKVLSEKTLFIRQ